MYFYDVCFSFIFALHTFHLHALHSLTNSSRSAYFLCFLHSLLFNTCVWSPWLKKGLFCNVLLIFWPVSMTFIVFVHFSQVHTNSCTNIIVHNFRLHILHASSKSSLPVLFLVPLVYFSSFFRLVFGHVFEEWILTAAHCSLSGKYRRRLTHIHF